MGRVCEGRKHRTSAGIHSFHPFQTQQESVELQGLGEPGSIVAQGEGAAYPDP